jgi:iron complex transport system substrate-binding protein
LAGGVAVGRPSASDPLPLPDGADGLPFVGRHLSPNPEAVLSLEPDLVLLVNRTEKQEALGELLRPAGVRTATLRYDNYDDFRDVMDLFCRLNGHRMAEYPPVRDLFAAVDNLCARVAGRPAPRFISLFISGVGVWGESNRANTPTMARRLGGVNVAGSLGGIRQRYSMERLLLDDPDVILLVPMGDPEAARALFAREWSEQPAWRQLSAVRNGRVHFLPREWFLYVPGDAFPRAFAHLSALLHPEDGPAVP